MKVHRFIGDFDLNVEKLTLTETSIVHQISRVLKLRIGEFLILSDGKGFESKAQILNISNKDVEVEIRDKNIGIVIKNKVHLYLCEIKRDLFELATQKATECGIDSLTPIISSRTLKKNLLKNRLEVIAKEASEQSGRSEVPNINNPISFEDALQNARGIKIFCTINGEAIENIEQGQEYSIFIGPEGGWSDEEITLAKKYNAKELSLGKTTLRAETAATISTFLFANK